MVSGNLSKLARVNDQEPKAATDSAGTGQAGLMAELVALRAIMLVLFKLAKGQTLTACACGGKRAQPLTGCTLVADDE